MGGVGSSDGVFLASIVGMVMGNKGRGGGV